MTTLAHIAELETLRDRRLLVFGASQIEIDLLPALYDTLARLGHQPALDVLVYSRGGAVNAARRIALLLDEFTDHLTFVVPHYCESAGTLMALAAREIIAGPTAIFSPIDPLLTTAASSAQSGPLALSCQDIRLFQTMGEDWFGLHGEEAGSRSLAVLCDSIFPTTLTSLYRCALEVQQIATELLALHMPDESRDVRAKIVDTLLFGFHSHTYAITRNELTRLGLRIVRAPAVEAAAWRIASELQGWMGPEACTSFDDDRFDALIATREGGVRRRRREDSPAGSWDALDSA